MAVKDVFSVNEKKIRENMYVLIENYKTYAEDVVGAYDTEILAMRDAKKMGIKKKKILKADVEYICVNNIEFMWDYTIKE